MTHMCIAVDDKIILDGDLGQWRHKPPAALANYIQPNGRKQPWVPALMAAILDATITNTPTAVQIKTHASGWTVSVEAQ